MTHPSRLDAEAKCRVDEILSRPTLARLATASPQDPAAARGAALVFLGWGVPVDERLPQHAQVP